MAIATPTRLTPRQRRSLTADGYLVMPSLPGGADLARITARLADHVRRTGAAWAEEPSLDTYGGCVMTRFAPDEAGLAPLLPASAALRHSGTFNYSPAARLALAG